MNFAQDGFITTRQAAAEYGVERNTISQWINRGLLPSAIQEPNTGWWFIPRADFEAFLALERPPGRRKGDS